MKVLERWKFYASFLLILITLATVICCMEEVILNQTLPYALSEHEYKSDKFREQNISDSNLQLLKRFSADNKLEFPKVLTVTMIFHNFDLNSTDISDISIKEYQENLRRVEARGGKSYQMLLDAYDTIWGDVKYFPIPVSTQNEKAEVTFSDSWMHERSFGGKRGHEGTDIMAGINKRGYYPIISMSDGIVEKIGWLTQGGYRIGIRSESGAYFYYAHLYRYAKEFQEGESVKAGQIIGYMGDSGYGDEGTTGKFAVHLHAGIYIKDENGAEVSVNPYPVLKYIENKKLRYAY